VALSITAPLSAQQTGAVVGEVHSQEEGVPIAGALVTLDTGSRTTSDSQGRYRLDGIPAGSHRIAAVAPGCHVGLGSVKVLAGRELGLDMAVPLPQEADKLLREWSPKERSSGDALLTMSGDEMRERHLASVMDAVRILAPDLVGAEDPLVIVDGVRVVQSPVDALAALNTEHIERISVAPEASSGWHYGMWGANGLIVVTTRRAEGEYAPDTPPGECDFVFPRPGESTPGRAPVTTTPSS